jgi:hypothetical protein
MMTRIRPMSMWQFNNGQGTCSLDYIEGYYGTSHPVSYYFYGGGGASYYGPTGDYTIDSIWASGDMDTAVWAPKTWVDSQLCAIYGIHHIAYEGGPSFDNNGSHEDVKALAVNDARLEGNVVAHHNAWSNYGGELLMYFDLTHDYQWGFTYDVFDTLDTPKFRAIADINAAPRAALTHGSPVDVTIDGNSYDAHSWSDNTSWMGTSLQLTSDRWAAYIFNIPRAGAYNISAVLSIVSTTNGGTAFIVDGVVISTDDLTATPVTHTHSTNFSAGLHSLRLKATSAGSGYVLVTSVEVTS